jgi:hypothetical protein
VATVVYGEVSELDHELRDEEGNKRVGEGGVAGEVAVARDECSTCAGHPTRRRRGRDRGPAEEIAQAGD